MARVSVFLALALVLGLVASALAGAIVVNSATGVTIDGTPNTGAITYQLNGNSPLTISCSTTGAACNYNSGITINDAGTGNAVTVANTVGFNSISFTAGAGTTFAVSAGATLTSTTTVTLSAVSTISGTFVSTGVATIGGTLTVASTGTLTLNSATTSTINAASTISGSLTGSASVTFTSTVTDNSVGATLNVGGLVFQNNVNLVAASTVTAGSAGLQISGGSAAIAAPITSGGNVAISTTGTNTINLSGNLAITGSLALSGASTGLYTIGGTTVTGSTTFSDTHSGALAFSATTATFGTGVTISTTGAATISGAITATTGNILVNPTGAIVLTGSLKANAGAASITLNAGAASTITGAANVNSLDAALLQFGPNVGNAFSGTTYTISGANIKFGTSIVFNAPTSFVNSALVTPSWSVTVSGGSAVSGPASVFTQTFASNVISSSLFPNGINTNCIQFDADTSITSFLISLPGAIAYRNLGKYTWGALTVTSTSAGAVTFCTPTITSTMDRRNDVHKNDLVYYGGQVVYFLSFSAALPFGSISATDFSVVGGTISSVSSLSATTWAIVVQITCDGVVSLNYNGSFTGGSVTSTYQSIVTQSNVRVVSAKCIANIYAPCS